MSNIAQKILQHPMRNIQRDILLRKASKASICTFQILIHVYLANLCTNLIRCARFWPPKVGKTSWGEVMLALGKLMKNDFVLLKLISQTFNDSSPFLSRGRSLNQQQGVRKLRKFGWINLFPKNISVLYLIGRNPKMKAGKIIDKKISKEPSGSAAPE